MSEAALATHLPSTLGGARTRLAEVSDKLIRTQARMKRFAQENEARIEGVMRGVEVVGGAAGAAYLTARYGKSGAALQIVGFDADMAIGGVLFAAGLFEMGGKYNAHLYDIGAGALACYAARELWAMGAKAAVAPATVPATAPVAATGGVQPASTWVPRR